MQEDSSSNTPLHYAAAYGWPECIKLLLKVGAEINAMNSWKVTPINIAMLKNHHGCVKSFLEYPEVDVNCKDEKGRILLTLALLDKSKDTTSFIEYLLKKGADPNIADIDGNTSLHHLAKQSFELSNFRYSYNMNQQELARDVKDRKKVQLQVADLLIANGASLSVKNQEKQTPFAVCLQMENIDLLEKLISDVSVNKDPSLLHDLSSKILNTKY